MVILLVAKGWVLGVVVGSEQANGHHKGLVGRSAGKPIQDYVTGDFSDALFPLGRGRVAGWNEGTCPVAMALRCYPLLKFGK